MSNSEYWDDVKEWSLVTFTAAIGAAIWLGFMFATITIVQKYVSDLITSYIIAGCIIFPTLFILIIFIPKR